MSVVRGPWKRNRLRRWRFSIAVAVMMSGLLSAVLFGPSAFSTVSNQLIDTPSAQTESLLGEPDRFSCSVSRITDGDTFRCSDGTRVRLHAVAARESDETCSPGHPCPSATAASATRALTDLIEGRTLSCEKTGTSYNRVTAVCWTPTNREVNCAMIRSGTTVIWDRFDRQKAICRS